MEIAVNRMRYRRDDAPKLAAKVAAAVAVLVLAACGTAPPVSVESKPPTTNDAAPPTRVVESTPSANAPTPEQTERARMELEVARLRNAILETRSRGMPESAEAFRNFLTAERVLRRSQRDGLLSGASGLGGLLGGMMAGALAGGSSQSIVNRRPPLPSLQWPPPPPSAQLVISGSAFTPTDGRLLLGDVESGLTNALRQSDYEYTYYRVPGGFAIVARLERILDDGTPIETRRFLPPEADEDFGILQYIEQLFFAPEGYYRLFIFVISDQPFVASGAKLLSTQTTPLLRSGANDLHVEIRQSEFTPSHSITALIYEFRKDAHARDVQTLDPGRLSGQIHFEKAGLAKTIGIAR